MADQQRRWRIWKLLLLLHLICYEVFFIYAIVMLHYPAMNYPWFVNQRNFIALLLWTLLLLVHVGAMYYQRGRGDISQLEREIYREGYADAMRQLGGQSAPLERLALDDEGELVELKEKRKRSYYEKQDG